MRPAETLLVMETLGRPIILCFLWAMLCSARDTCSDTKIVILGAEDKLALLQGNCGFPGTLGAYGDVGMKGARNCKELLERGTILSGWYTICPEDGKPMTVLCDMDTDGGGWIVFQRRWDDSVDFFRDWKTYKMGFGSQMTNFWLGNDNLHYLTAKGNNELRIDLQDFEKNKYFATYSSFNIGSESEKYKLTYQAFTAGNAGNSLDAQLNQPFSTKDQDNDSVAASSCAAAYKGGWWYGSCHHSNLNGLYLGGTHTSYADGINWSSGKGYRYSYKTCEMKFRPI